MSTRLRISLACGDDDRTRPILDGRIGIEGCELAALALTPEEGFFRAFRHQAFDVAELYAMARLLDRLGYVWKRPKVVPAKSDAEADPAIPLLFVAATHPAYDAHPASGWIRRGERAVLPSNHGRVNVTLNGALSWPARAVITREAVKITGPEMAAFFAQIEARYPAARTITLIADNATYNRAAVVRAWLARPGCRVRVV